MAHRGVAEDPGRRLWSGVRLMRPRGVDLAARFARQSHRGDGEPLSQLEHALQCAALARRAGSDDEVVVAALLHDVGHLLSDAGPLPPERPNRHHGRVGAVLIRPFTSARLAWLVEHHVTAKRYLCSVDPGYAATLSAASLRSLAWQGAGLDIEERTALETNPWLVDALRIRRWDDEAKDPTARPAPLIAYRTLLEGLFGPQSWSDGIGIGIGR